MAFFLFSFGVLILVFSFLELLKTIKTIEIFVK
jgi:hypothetical protein